MMQNYMMIKRAWHDRNKQITECQLTWNKTGAWRGQVGSMSQVLWEYNGSISRDRIDTKWETESIAGKNQYNYLA